MSPGSDLVRELKQSPRDELAFRRWYEAAFPALFTATFRLTRGDRAAAEDLCQEAVVAFVSKGGLAKVNSHEEALAYLITSARNRFIDVLRSRRLEVVVESVPDTEIAQAGLPDIAVHAVQVLRRLLERLNDTDRKILALMLGGETVSRIAKEVGLSYSNAGVRMHRIRRTISELGMPV